MQAAGYVPSYLAGIDGTAEPGRIWITESLEYPRRSAGPGRDRIKVLEQRLSDVESGTVLSEPETRVKRIEVYVDKNGNEHDSPVEGAKKTVTYDLEYHGPTGKARLMLK